jgi:hypothetical protein
MAGLYKPHRHNTAVLTVKLLGRSAAVACADPTGCKKRKIEQTVTFLALIIPFLLITFWLWMFSDMLQNDDIPSTRPAGFHWPPVAKNHWTVYFMLLNIFTAGYYYCTVYRNR